METLSFVLMQGPHFAAADEELLWLLEWLQQSDGSCLPSWRNLCSYILVWAHKYSALKSSGYCCVLSTCRCKLESWHKENGIRMESRDTQSWDLFLLPKLRCWYSGKVRDSAWQEKHFCWLKTLNPCKSAPLCWDWWPALWLRGVGPWGGTGSSRAVPCRAAEGVELIHMRSMQANRQRKHYSPCFSIRSQLCLLKGFSDESVLFFLSTTSADWGMESFYSWSEGVVYCHPWVPQGKGTQTEQLFPAALPREGVASPS